MTNFIEAKIISTFYVCGPQIFKNAQESSLCDWHKEINYTIRTSHSMSVSISALPKHGITFGAHRRRV